MERARLVQGVLVSLIFLLCLFIVHIEVKLDAEVQKNAAGVKFGKTFDGLTASTVLFGCRTPNTNLPICCEAVSNGTNENSRGVGLQLDGYGFGVGGGGGGGGGGQQQQQAKCTIEKQYISSPQELRELSQAIAIYSSVDSDWDEAKTLRQFVEYTSRPDSIANATKWLERVRVHMQSGEIPEATADDYEYLSRFHVTKKCAHSVTSWDEWIEPITMHARHPFSMSSCHPYQKELSALNRRMANVSVTSVDYVLLQSGRALANAASHGGQQHTYSNTNPNTNKKSGGQSQGSDVSAPAAAIAGHRPSKHILLDAGASTFVSSEFYFTCGYSQRRISFDAVYAWEMTLLDPRSYWALVPPKWKPFIHFSNVPISEDHHHPDSPLRFIDSVAEHDFVSFKLDIDHPSTEIPIAMEIATSASDLVDEFFFEFHFHCEVLQHCGWGHVPKEHLGVKLDRLSIFNFFLDLRRKGVRSHIWP